ncbi:MAG: hypothetical protein HY867_11415 [Chloroflexi bacterium]|nr:hypothetical protein [Chloroflexota bacterium]
MKNARQIRWFSLIVLATLLMGCSMGAAAPTATPVPPTDTPIPPTATPVPPTATPLPTDTPLPTPTPGPIVIDDDFSADNGRFTCESCTIEGGQLTIGPFPLVDSWQPFTVLCNDCGDVPNYKMSVDTWYNSGNNSFGWGLVVRQDEKTTYLIASSSWLVYNVFSFDLSSASSGGLGYKSLIRGWDKKSGLVAGRGVNHFEITMQGSTMTIMINGLNLRTFDLPTNDGQVGLWVGNWETSAFFDNFHFEEIR